MDNSAKFCFLTTEYINKISTLFVSEHLFHSDDFDELDNDYGECFHVPQDRKDYETHHFRAIYVDSKEVVFKNASSNVIVVYVVEDNDFFFTSSLRGDFEIINGDDVIKSTNKVCEEFLNSWRTK